MRDPTDEEIAAILSVLEDDDKLETTLLSDKKMKDVEKTARLPISLKDKVFRIIKSTAIMVGLDRALIKKVGDQSYLTQLTQEVMRQSGRIQKEIKQSVYRRAMIVAAERAAERPKGQRRKQKQEADAIAAVINQNIIEGDLPLTEMNRDVRERAERVRDYVEDELHKISIGLFVTIAQQLGLLVEFRTERDDRVCPLCMSYDGKVYAANNAPIPVDDTHPNCRCVLIPLVRMLR